MKYIVIDASGLVLRSGICQDESIGSINVGPGETLVENVSSLANHHTRKMYYINGSFEDRGPVIQATYITQRRGAYPPIGDQLDMLWHAMDTGQIPKAQQFYNAIKQVKDKYKKP